MIYDRQWFRDVRAKLDQANALKDTPPQNDHSAPFVKAPEVDYGMYACLADVAVPPDDFVPNSFVVDLGYFVFSYGSDTDIALSVPEGIDWQAELERELTKTFPDTAPSEYCAPDFDGA